MKYATKGILDFAMPLRSLLICLLLLLPWVSSCSYVSLPSLPWSRRPIDPNPTAEKLFNEGTAYLDGKKYALAIESFKQLQSEFPFAPELIQAELKLGESYYLNKQYPEAISAFKEFQSMHPTNENVPFAIYHLGLANLVQFTNVDREQKLTAIAKDYFETLVKNYPASPYAAEAKEKLAECVSHLAQHDFNIANFYIKDQNYPAARERLEGILRLYPQSPLSDQVLYGLGETYRLEKNTVKAALAYEALIQHFPDTPLAKQAQGQMEKLNHEKQDPLALLLMRDHRPTFAAAPARTNGETQVASAGAQNSKAETPDLNSSLHMIAKTDVVYEEPGSDKGLFRRIADTLNPFSSSSSSSSSSAASAADKANGVEKPKPVKEQSNGFFASLWPFSSKKDSQDKTKTAVAGDPGLVQKIDESLKQKGVDTGSPNTASNAPAADLSNVASQPAPPPRVDTTELLGHIDANLQKDGKNVAELPPSPEPDPALNRPIPVAQDGQHVAPSKPRLQAAANTSGVITNIDEKLKAKGIDASKVSLAAPGEQTTPYRPEMQGSTPQQGQGKIELAPRMSVDKGPLFLEKGELRVEELDKGEADKEKIPSEKTTEPIKELPEAVVKGPAEQKQQKTAEVSTNQKKITGEAEENNKGALDQIKEDIGRIQTMLNPFSW